ncbi:MAG: RNA methyltransferase [Candidatus Margulisiibacteriota bacterium]
MTNKLTLAKNLIKGNRSKRKGLFIVEGPHLVEEAIEQIEFLLYSRKYPVLKVLMGKGVPCSLITEKEFSQVSQVEAPQGILAVAREKNFVLESLFRKPDPLIVICAGIQDPGNLGTIIRTADAAGAAGVILSKGTVDLYNQKVIRSSMGSIFHLPIISGIDLAETIGKLKEKGVKILAADADGKKIYFESDLKGPLAILLGNEGSGIESNIIGYSDETVSIPMPGRAESLNAGVSAGIIIYEALKQRINGK